MKLPTAVLLFATLALSLVGVGALYCNECNSLASASCGATLTSSSGSCSATGSCYTFTGTIGGTYGVVRGCTTGSSSSCTAVNTVVDGSRITGTYCYCYSANYCNGGNYAITTMPNNPSPSSGGTVVCYSCNSLSNSNCGYGTLNANANADVCRGKSCITFYGKADGANFVVRSCSDASLTGCYDVDTVSNGISLVGTTCGCQTNYCNRNVQTSNPATDSAAAKTKVGLTMTIIGLAAAMFACSR